MKVLRRSFQILLLNSGELVKARRQLYPPLFARGQLYRVFVIRNVQTIPVPSLEIAGGFVWPLALRSPVVSPAAVRAVK